MKKPTQTANKNSPLGFGMTKFKLYLTKPTKKNHWSHTGVTQTPTKGAFERFSKVLLLCY